MADFDTVEELADAIKTKFTSTPNNKNVITLYAFNSTGKTRLSNLLNIKDETDGDTEDEEIRSLCYNVFLEDMFRWDNDNYVLQFDRNSWFAKIIIEQGLEGEIVRNFREIIDSKVEPAFDFISSSVVFNIVSGDNASETNVKISKGEESVFIWSFFYTILVTVISILNCNQEDKTTHEFDNLKYIIIDDPVSSIDDTKIIAIAIKLVDAIKTCKNNQLNFFVTTHHALFYNVLMNSFKRNDAEFKFRSYSLLKDNYIFKLSEQKSDTPFSYHIFVKNIIKSAINTNTIERYHFNLFRNLLEKTSNFLGYDNWGDCINISDKAKFIRLLNNYSHSKISELESRELSGEEKKLFKEVFNTFITDFKWK